MDNKPYGMLELREGEDTAANHENISGQPRSQDLRYQVYLAAPLTTKCGLK